MSEEELKKTVDSAMKDKIHKILVFLKENEKYNHELQEKYYLSVLCPYHTLEDKVMSLLYDIANTQSQPRINKLSGFYKEINKNKETFLSFNNFVKRLIIIHTEKKKETKHLSKKFQDNQNYQTLFEVMKVQDGWGDKTAALFVKNIYNYHSGKYDIKLKIWSETPNLDKDDKIFLPVDTVIIAIFNRLEEIINESSKKKNWTFHKINKFLRTNNYSNEEILLLDDLWFWGFITQKTIKGESERKFECNRDKYWMIKDAPKDSETISKIENKAKKFLDILEIDDKSCNSSEKTI